MTEQQQRLKELKKKNDRHIPMEETDVWSFLERKYGHGDFIRHEAARSYLDENGVDHGVPSIDKTELVETLFTIIDHYGWVKARERSCKVSK